MLLAHAATSFFFAFMLVIATCARHADHSPW
jgi:hypothetical protein